ncbi:MAG: hypothetical protein ABUL48_03565 [Pseudorhodoplanes sp.]
MKWIAKSGLQRLKLGRAQIRLPMIAAGLCLIGAIILLPRAMESVNWLLVEDDPAALADKKLATAFNETVAAREIDAALTAKDVDLAKSFVELARDRQVPIPAELADKVDAAVKAEDTAVAKAGAFTRGLITGEPDDLVSLAGTALGDLFVFGDIRDVVREGSRLATGQEADRLILGLAGVGIAITVGTYATLGAGSPARIGLTVVKAARKTGRLGTRLGESIARSLRGVVDWSGLRKGLAGASLTEPAVAVRAVREAVKVEKADNLLRLVSDVGRVQSKAGTKAALDGLKTANTPVEMGRIAKLAEKSGGKTRAILKLLGRGAIALTIAAFDLALWIFWALLMLFGFVSSMKSAVERTTHRRYVRKKAKRIAEQHRRLAMAAERG